MSVRAVMKSGQSAKLAPRHGETALQVIEGLVREGMTGSAAPLSDAWLTTEDGGAVRYSEVERFEVEDS